MGNLSRRQGFPKFCSMLLPSHERITLAESGHAVRREGVRKLSRRRGTPNFVPCFFLFTRENPWLSLVTQQGGEVWEVDPTSTESKRFSLLLPSHERITLIESGHAAGSGGVGKLSRRPGTPNFVPASSFSREKNPGWVSSRTREGRRGEVVPTLRDSKLCSLLLPSPERITLVKSGHAAGKGGVGELSRRPGTPNYFPASSFSREINPG